LIRTQGLEKANKFALQSDQLPFLELKVQQKLGWWHNGTLLLNAAQDF
jgi:hypothetical protein